MDVTRRGLSRIAAGALASVAAQSGDAQTASQPENADLENAREVMRANLQQIAKIELPMATEPACHFKA